MIRREFVRKTLVAALGAGAAAVTPLRGAAGAGDWSADTAPDVEWPAETPADGALPAAEFPKAPGLTKYVAQFIVNTKYSDIPADVLDLGKKSILDGFGLALAGSASVMGPLVRNYVEIRLEIIRTNAVPASSDRGEGHRVSRRLPMAYRFMLTITRHATFVGEDDRIYGLLTHPTVATLTSRVCTRRTGEAYRKGNDAGVSRGRGSGMQNRRGHLAAPLQRRFSYHRNLRIVWQRRGLREAARAERAANGVRPGNRSDGGRRLPRQFWFDDQTVPRGTRRGKWHRRRGSCGAGLDGCRRYSGSAAGIFSGCGRRV